MFVDGNYGVTESQMAVTTELSQNSRSKMGDMDLIIHIYDPEC